MIGVELCCSSIRGNADPGVALTLLGFFGVALVVIVLIRRRMPNPPRTSRNSFGGGSIFVPTPPKITLNKTLIDGQEVTVIDQAQVSHVVDTLKTPAGLKAALAANPNLWAEVNAALSGAGAIDPNGPLPVVARVRSALLTGQLDTVRQLLSDQLYQRLKALPPPTPNPSTLQVLMTTNQKTGDDPNRVVVGVSGSRRPGTGARELGPGERTRWLRRSCADPPTRGAHLGMPVLQRATRSRVDSLSLLRDGCHDGDTIGNANGSPRDGRLDRGRHFGGHSAGGLRPRPALR